MRPFWISKSDWRSSVLAGRNSTVKVVLNLQERGLVLGAIIPAFFPSQETNVSFRAPCQLPRATINQWPMMRRSYPTFELLVQLKSRHSFAWLLISCQGLIRGIIPPAARRLEVSPTTFPYPTFTYWYDLPRRLESHHISQPGWPESTGLRTLDRGVHRLYICSATSSQV
jgi:hypothetical protein